MSITVASEWNSAMHVWIVITVAMTIGFVKYSVAVQDILTSIVLLDLSEFLGCNHVLQLVDIDIS